MLLPVHEGVVIYINRGYRKSCKQCQNGAANNENNAGMVMEIMKTILEINNLTFRPCQIQVPMGTSNVYINCILTEQGIHMHNRPHMLIGNAFGVFVDNAVATARSEQQA